MVKLVCLVCLILSLTPVINDRSTAENYQTKEEVVVDTLAKALTVPWDICFLPGGEMLFTERPGRVRIIRNNQLQASPILSITDINARGKMGLLGLCLHPSFRVNRFVYLAYNYRSDNDHFLKVVRYEYRGDQLILSRNIIEKIPAALNHTGSRITFGPDNKLYITTGDADVPRLAQDLKSYAGKILRLNEDGTIPADNPFVQRDTARHEIWSYGHRNPQGLTFQAVTGSLYVSEHGPTGGDEINVVEKGRNYGWPVIHHRESRISMMSPAMEFSPSIGPAQALFYSGKAFSSLKGNLLVACMRGEGILNIQFAENKIAGYNFLLKNRYARIRAVAEAPDGYLYFSTSQVDPPESKLQPGDSGFDMILRLRPKKARSSGNAFNIETSASLVQAIRLDETPATVNITSKSSETLYAQLCAGCHGVTMQGKDKVPSLLDKKWVNGGTRTAIHRSISKGIVSRGMPSWEGVLSNEEINQMVTYILAARRSDGAR